MANEPLQRFVFDVNALISAFLFPASAPGRTLELVHTRHELLMSLELAADAIEVFRREKFDRYLSRERREASGRGYNLIEVRYCLGAVPACRAGPEASCSCAAPVEATRCYPLRGTGPPW